MDYFNKNREVIRELNKNNFLDNDCRFIDKIIKLPNEGYAFNNSINTIIDTAIGLKNNNIGIECSKSRKGKL